MKYSTLKTIEGKEYKIVGINRRGNPFFQEKWDLILEPESLKILINNFPLTEESREYARYIFENHNK